MKAKTVLCVSFLSFLCFAVGAYGQPVVVVGDHGLQPETADQIIQILIGGGGDLAGANLYAQVGDGGPELAGYGLPPGTDGPAITAVNFEPVGGIFTGKGTQTDLGGLPQVALHSFDVTAGTVDASGLLMELTFDTTGFDAGTWDLLLANVLPQISGGPYTTAGVGPGGVDVSLAITNGTITVTPEPATMALLSLGLASLAALRRRGK